VDKNGAEYKFGERDTDRWMKEGAAAAACGRNDGAHVTFFAPNRITYRL